MALTRLKRGRTRTTTTKGGRRVVNPVTTVRRTGSVLVGQGKGSYGRYPASTTLSTIPRQKPIGYGKLGQPIYAPAAAPGATAVKAGPTNVPGQIGTFASSVGGPPPGTYDPALDAAYGAAYRGYGDLSEDVQRQARYGLADYIIKTDDLKRQRSEGLADLLLGQGRAQQDLQTGLSNLSLQYNRLGNRQSQQAQAMGVSRGGALQQAFNKRLANHLRDVQPLQQSYNRFTQDTVTKARRLNEGTDRGLAAAGLDLQRAGEGWTNQLKRGGRELNQFGIDTTAQKYYAATQGGWVPPAQGGGQTFNRHGLTYQVKNFSGPADKRTYQYGGNVYNRKQWLDFLRRRGIK